MLYNIIVIIASLIAGVFLGRIANRLFNKEIMTINPMICTIVGMIGGGLGSWIFSTLPLNLGMSGYLYQFAAGIGLAILLLLFLIPFRDKSEGDI